MNDKHTKSDWLYYSLFYVVILVFFALVADASQVKAQPQAKRVGPQSYITVGKVCMSYQDVRKKAKSYGEYPTMDWVFMGHTHTLWVNPEDGSWTHTTRAPTANAKTCIFGFGKGGVPHSAPGSGI